MKKRTIKAADLFCGAGGTSSGLIQACRDLGRDVELFAVNHWDVAIHTHSTNHSGARHACANLFNLESPPEHFDILWASMECTNHSRAKGNKPRCDQSRAQADIIPKWLPRVNILGIENVWEFTGWEGFEPWLEKLREHGFKPEWRKLNAADYGGATTRERFVLLARKDGKPVQWPEQTHSKHGDLYTHKWRAASEIIDWDYPAKDINQRRKPLVACTMRRITDGLTRFPGKPFIISYYGNSKCALSVDDPLDTVTTRDRFALIVPRDGKILFRMFQPHELAASMGFPEEYKFSGSKCDIVKQIGNAVEIRMATAVFKAVLA